MNNFEKLLRPQEVCSTLGISYSTLRRWIRDGKIKAVRTPTGRIRIPKSEIERILGREVPTKTRCVIYARVSSTKQEEQGDLQRQVELLKKYAHEHRYEIVEIITDVASGLKENRRGLRRLFKLVVNRKVDVVLVTFRDRLTRFGFEYLKYFFKQFGVDIVCILDEKKSPLEEIIEDFISIVVSFAGRIYGMRSHKVKKLVSMVERELSDVWTR